MTGIWLLSFGVTGIAGMDSDISTQNSLNGGSVVSNAINGRLQSYLAIVRRRHLWLYSIYNIMIVFFVMSSRQTFIKFPSRFERLMVVDYLSAMPGPFSFDIGLICLEQ